MTLWEQVERYAVTGQQPAPAEPFGPLTAADSDRRTLRAHGWRLLMLSTNPPEEAWSDPLTPAVCSLELATMVQTRRKGGAT